MPALTNRPLSVPKTAPTGAVFAMSLGIFSLVAAEFLPASMLTLIATDMQISEGLAGQAVTATALVAVGSSLIIPWVAGRIERRKVLLFLMAVLLLANLGTAFSPNLGLLLGARLGLGVALGGFWALSAATMMRLVTPEALPKALAILFAGVSAATVFAAPFGSWLGAREGWRLVFIIAALPAALSMLALWLTLPTMPPQGQSRLANPLNLLRRPNIAMGILGLLLVFATHFAFFTYLRAFLEQITQAGPAAVTSILFVFGAMGFIGNSLSSWLISRSLRATLAAMPLLLAALALCLALFGGALASDSVIIGLWGAIFGVVPVSWSTWITRAAPNDAETGGGLVVATANLAITLGAGLGGLLFDLAGHSALLAGCVVLALSASALAACLRF